MIKDLIKKSPLLYFLWYHLYRKNRGVRIKYFTSETRYLLDGYPRSGNTFAMSLAGYFFGKEKVIHHFHAIAPVKVAFMKRLPVFILLRNPADAITSNYLKEYALSHQNIPDKINHPLLATLAKEYVDYYRYVKGRRSKLTIIEFSKLIASPKEVVEAINSTVFNNSKSITDDEMKAAAASYKGSTDTFGSSRPNEQKESLKDKLKQELFKMDAYSEAKALFDELKAR